MGGGAWQGVRRGVWEGQRAGDAPPPHFFHVLARRSFDGGATWTSKRSVYNASTAGRNAGAPQVVAHGGRLTVSFMTDEDSGKAHWVDDASSKMLTARNDGGGGAPLQFAAEDRVVARAGPGALWPGLFATQDGAEAFVTFGQAGSTFIQGPI